MCLYLKLNRLYSTVFKTVLFLYFTIFYNFLLLIILKWFLFTSFLFWYILKRGCYNFVTTSLPSQYTSSINYILFFNNNKTILPLLVFNSYNLIPTKPGNLILFLLKFTLLSFSKHTISNFITLSWLIVNLLRFFVIICYYYPHSFSLKNVHILKIN